MSGLGPILYPSGPAPNVSMPGARRCCRTAQASHLPPLLTAGSACVSICYIYYIYTICILAVRISMPHRMQTTHELDVQGAGGCAC